MKRLVQALLGTVGLRLTRCGSAPHASLNSLAWFFFFLKERGFAPRHIVDVGANHGDWTRTALKYFPDAHYTLVEPQEHLRTYVQDLLARDGRIRWVGAGAGDQVGTLPLTVSHRDDSSSFAFAAEAAKAGAHQIDVPVTTLNELVRAGNAPFPDIVKIDAEGFDLRVLAGASELVGKTDVFLLEAMICGGYENTLEAVIQAMSGLGYRIVAIHDLNNSPRYGLLWLCEVAFVRIGSPILDGIDTYEEVPSGAQALSPRAPSVVLSAQET